MQIGSFDTLAMYLHVDTSKKKTSSEIPALSLLYLDVLSTSYICAI